MPKYTDETKGMIIEAYRTGGRSKRVKQAVWNKPICDPKLVRTAQRSGNTPHCPVAERSPKNTARVAGTNHQAVTDGKRVAEKFSLSRWKEVKPNLKYRIIHTFSDRYPIREMCSFFEVSRSGYYCYLRRKDRPDSNLPLAELIRECQAERGKSTVIATSIYGLAGESSFIATPKQF